MQTKKIIFKGETGREVSLHEIHDWLTLKIIYTTSLLLSSLIWIMIFGHWRVRLEICLKLNFEEILERLRRRGGNLKVFFKIRVEYPEWGTLMSLKDISQKNQIDQFRTLKMTTWTKAKILKNFSQVHHPLNITFSVYYVDCQYWKIEETWNKFFSVFHEKILSGNFSWQKFNLLW